MSLKYCFGEEIHKTYDLPQNFASLLKDISLSFAELPSTYILQYTDGDGDRITISTDHDYQTLIQHELLRAASIKITILLPNNSKVKKSLSSGSFEVIDDDQPKTEDIQEVPLANSPKKEYSQDEEDGEEEEEDAKVVVSLQIPQIHHKNIQCSEELRSPLKSEEQQADLAAVTSKAESAKYSESFDLDLSFPQEEKTSENEEVNDVPPPQILQRGFQTEEEEGLNLSKRSPKIKREKSQEQNKRNIPATFKNQSRELLDSSMEVDLKDSKELFNTLFKKKAQVPIIRDFSRHINNLNNSKINGKRKKSIDESLEYCDLKNEQQEKPTVTTTNYFETRRRNLFNFRKSPDNWFYQNQENRNHLNLRGERAESNEELERLRDLIGQRSQRRTLLRERKARRLRLHYSPKSDSMSPDKTIGQIGVEEDKKKINSSQEESQVNQLLPFLPNKTVRDIENDGENNENNQTNKLQQTYVDQETEADIWYDPQDIQTYFQNNLQSSPQQSETTKKPDLDLINHFQSELSKPLISFEEPQTHPSLFERKLTKLDSVNASLTISETNDVNSFVGYEQQFHEPKLFGMNNNQQATQALNRWVVSKKKVDDQMDGEWPFSDEPSANFFEKQQTPFDCDDLFNLLKIGGTKAEDHPTSFPEPPASNIEGHKSRNFDYSPIRNKTNFTNDDFRFRLDGSKDEGENNMLKESLDLLGHRQIVKQEENFQFECREISSTPLWIKSNQREWCLIYKTVCLKNTGSSKWRRCYLEPIGPITGTMTEVSFVVPGDVVFLTLEIHGFFTPGSYTSHWRVVHQNESDSIDEMGTFPLHFDILEN